MADFADTIAALSTPSGESAIALVRLSGPACADLAKACFNLPSAPAARRAARGLYTLKNSSPLDDCVFTFFKAPSSYTGEDMLEISCHGNPFIVQNMLCDLFERGARAAGRGEFTRRAFLNAKLDLSQAEAVALMISSRSAKSLEAARRQLGGELSKRVNKMCDTLVEALARTEAYIDFSDEDLPPQSLDFSKSLLEKFCAEAERLASTSRYGAVLRDGLNVSIIGEPNAGKSSLLNGLLGRRRAIVSDVAGTTRDFIAERIELDGWIVNLTDTAGIRNSSDDIEREGISSALSLAKDADLKLLVVDVSRPNPEIFDLAKDCLDSKNTILVLNKIDLPRCKGLPLPRGFKTVEISCLKETGLEDLKRVVSEFIRENSINSSFDDILVSARHMELVDSAIRAAREAAEKISRAQPMELIASDIRAALDSVGEIVGRLDREEVLDKIFSTFCVGK